MNCPQCGCALYENQQINDSLYCRCGWYGPKNFYEQRRLKIRKIFWGRVSLGLALTLAAYVLYEFDQWRMFAGNHIVLQAKRLTGQMREKDWQDLGVICNTMGKPKCASKAYTQLLDLEPSNTIYLANLAQAEAELGMFDSAVARFEKLHGGGMATYDTMLSYAKSLEGLGREDEAILWYYRGLGIKPNLVDTIDHVLDLLTQKKRFDEALSFVGSLSYYEPRLREFFKARIQVISDLSRTHSSLDSHESLRLVSIQNHHFLPLRFNLASDPHLFMIDTGASKLTLPYQYLRDQVVGPIRILGAGVAELVDGRQIETTRVLIKRIFIGGWHLDNVEAVVCDSCAPLAGKNLLRHFEMRTHQANGLEYLDLRKSKPARF
ncbi:MAG: aspartyl protease family protein [Bdellovibrionales bacterium]